MRWSEDDLRSCNLGRFCIEEIPFRIENFFDRDIRLDEAGILDLASKTMSPSRVKPSPSARFRKMLLYWT